MTLNGDLPAPCYQPLVSWQLHSKRRLRIGQLCVQGVLFSTVGPRRKSLSPFQVSTTSCSPPISCNSTINYWLQLQRLPAAAVTTCLATIIKSLSQVELLKSQICIISLLGFKGSQLMTCLVNHGLEEFLVNQSPVHRHNGLLSLLSSQVACVCSYIRYCCYIVSQFINRFAFSHFNWPWSGIWTEPNID